jgi:predicted  nucleic acid-binding Zn-ribbon protein
LRKETMMSDPGTTNGRAPLQLEDVARASAELAAEPELDKLLARFLDRVREWASPSALLAAVRDPAAESGWRLLPALSLGSGPLGAERALPRLIDETPGCLERPTLFQPGESAPGVQLRDNCIVPWVHESESGVLLLRGLPRPSAPNLGEAVAVLAAPVWPRLLGSPAARVESLVVELRRVAERLEEDAGRHLERLRASRPPAAPGPGENETGRVDRAAELETQLEAARQEGERSTVERDELRERLIALETALKEAEAERDRVLAEAAGLDERKRETEDRARVAAEALSAAQRELESARAEGEHATLEWEELKGRVATLQEALQNTEAERDGARDESERLAARAESLQTERASAVEQLEEHRRAVSDGARTAEDALASVKQELESARLEAQRATGELGELRGRLATLEEALPAAESERDEVRASLERLEAERRAAGDAARSVEDSLATTQRELEAAREEERRATVEAGELRARVASLEKTLRDTEAERDGARGRAETLKEQNRVAEAASRTAEEAVVSMREQLAATQAAVAPAGGSPEVIAKTEQALGALRSTLHVLRRTPFVPPGLRVSMEEGRALVGEKGSEGWMRVALLDRDAASLEPLASQLEDAGLVVKIANYPEELALLMKTPDAQKLNVAVCDILAFRPDQTVAGLFRGWQKDRPGLAFFLSFSAEDAAEAERAKRVPISLTVGRLPRPIPGAELIEKLQVLAQKQAGSEA